jgi:hypothetical protein
MHQKHENQPFVPDEGQCFHALRPGNIVEYFSVLLECFESVDSNPVLRED